MAKELEEAKAKVKELQEQLDGLLEESVSLKGENNSLKKKVQSLQIDVEKMSRKIDTTRTASGQESEDDGMFNVVNEDGPGTACSLNNANLSVGLGPSDPNSTALNQSIRSDNGIQPRSNKFDMIGGAENDRHDTITLSDEAVEPDFNTAGGKKVRDTLTQRIMESHIGKENSSQHLVEEVKQGGQKTQSVFI